MSTNFRTVLERWRDLADADLLCLENPAETDWGAVVVAIAATRAALAQPEGQSSLNVNLTIDTSSENLKRLCDGLTKAVTPNGGYEAATTDDPAPGTGGDQVVEVQWWIPQHGCDSLENTLDAIKYRIGRAVMDWWATALVPAALAQPKGDGPSLAEVDELCAKFGFHYDDDQGETLEILQEMITAAIARWGRPATLPPLPPNYIDPEHQGEDLELLQTFYRACMSEGGTADQIHLRGIRAVLATLPAASQAPEVGEASQLLAWIKQYRDPMHPVHDSDEIAQLTRAATLLQQQEARIAGLRSALTDCGRAVGASIGDDCSDDFLLKVPAEVRLAVAKPRPGGGAGGGE